MRKALVRGCAAVALGATCIGIGMTAANAATPNQPVSQQQSHKQGKVSGIIPTPQTTITEFLNSTAAPVTFRITSYTTHGIPAQTVTKVLQPGQREYLGAGMNDVSGSDDVNGTITYGDGTTVFFHAACPWGWFATPWAGFGHGDNYQHFVPGLTGQDTKFTESGKSFVVSVNASNSMGTNFLVDAR